MRPAMRILSEVYQLAGTGSVQPGCTDGQSSLSDRKNTRVADLFENVPNTGFNQDRVGNQLIFIDPAGIDKRIFKTHTAFLQKFRSAIGPDKMNIQSPEYQAGQCNQDDYFFHLRAPYV